MPRKPFKCCGGYLFHELDCPKLTKSAWKQRVRTDILEPSSDPAPAVKGPDGVWRQEEFDVEDHG